jgi:hypothetical protein
VFQHITILFSFIFAIAFTHILSSVSALVLAKDRVRFSALHALWMCYASGNLLFSWVAISSLESVKHWSISEVLVQLSWVVPMYFTCSLIAIRVPDSGIVDMEALYERRRPAIFSAYVVLAVTSMLENFFDRNNLKGWTPLDWIGADLQALPNLVCALVAGWAKPRWAQWLAVWVTVAQLIWVCVSYTGVD